MRRPILTVILLLFCTYMFSMETEFENLRVHMGTPRDIPSNGTGTFELRINNRGDAALHNLELSAMYDDDLLVVLGQPKINTLEPGETVRVTMEITSNRSHFFDRHTFVTLTIADEDHAGNFRFRFTINPVENFWFFAVLALASAMIVLFIIVYIKADKGEKNAG